MDIQQHLALTIEAIDSMLRWWLWSMRCDVCGCSFFDPCDGGCFWIEPYLCSMCAALDDAIARELQLAL